MQRELKWLVAGATALVLYCGMAADAEATQASLPGRCEQSDLSPEVEAACDAIARAPFLCMRSGQSEKTELLCDRAYRWWRRERERRQAELDAYVEDNRDDFNSFRTAPLGIKQGALNFVGMQMIIFRLLTGIFPDIWGPPEEEMLVIGFGPDPFDPDSVMPLGTGFALSSPSLGGLSVNYMNATCMACHSGGVVGPEGELIRTIGGANPFGDYFGAINRTVNDPRYTAENFRAALDSKPVGWIYGFDPALIPQELLERALFNAPGGAEFFLEEAKFASNAGAKRVAETLGTHTYNIPDPPLAAGMPGSLDVFSLAAAQLADPDDLSPAELEAALPAAPGPADIPAAWQQIDRPRFQWDNSVGDLTYREVAASLSVSGGDPAAVNLDNVVAASRFTENLPAHPYPFDVNLRAAVRGERIYRKACAGCHEPGNDVLSSPQETGTDPNRANIFTDFIVSGLIEQFRAACTIPECFEPNGDPVPDSDVLEPTGGYVVIPLTGVWQTAPYLHNGSVPTLYHLITGDRPDTFYRGNFTYDEKLVGYTWDEATSPRALLYDTSRAGYANTGHAGPAFNGGIDWEAEPDKLWNLLEYLKTL